MDTVKPMFLIHENRLATQDRSRYSPHRASGATDAFSLVELSIVLVILGLLVGGILGGQSLIRAAELRAVNTEYEQWRVAMNTFRQRFNAWPGDFNKATQFWGAASGTCTVSGGNDWLEGNGKTTCNGDGNGEISREESLIFWQHLANAGLVGGSYNGRAGTGVSVYVPGENIPVSKAGGAWMLRSNTGSRGYTDWQSAYVNALVLGMHDSYGYFRGVLRPEDLWGIDTKMDDGLPHSGEVQAYLSSSHIADCATGISGSVEYNLASDQGVCGVSLSIGIPFRGSSFDFIDGGEGGNFWQAGVGGGGDDD